MLRLIICELLKLKRKKFISLVILSAFFFPVPLTVFMTLPRFTEGYESKAALFNDYYSNVMGFGVEMLLPCVIGVIAALLFFMERDNDTFKNLRVIPVTSTQMILAKIAVLFLFGMIFSLVSAFVSILCGSLAAEVSGIAYKIFLAVEMGIFITAGTLPLVVLVVFFSKTYIFSVLLCVFYSVLSMTAESCFETLPKAACYLMPIPLTTLWAAGDMMEHGIRDKIGRMEYLIPSTGLTVLILGTGAFCSVILIDYLYKKRGEK